LIQILQYVQNSAARLLTGSRKYDHITPILKDLHWFVRQRIVFRILTLTFKALHDVNSTQYLKDMLQLYKLQSSAQPPLISKKLLSVPKFEELSLKLELSLFVLLFCGTALTDDHQTV
jgi:hypothetical protein